MVESLRAFVLTGSGLSRCEEGGSGCRSFNVLGPMLLNQLEVEESRT